MKKKVIRKKFTSKEDEILLNIMLQSKTKTTGFKEASEKLNRSLDSIKSRWYHVTIFQYDVGLHSYPGSRQNTLNMPSSSYSYPMARTA